MTAAVVQNSRAREPAVSHVVPVSGFWLPALRLRPAQLTASAVPFFSAVAMLFGVGAGLASLAVNAADSWAFPSLILEGIGLAMLLAHEYRVKDSISAWIVMLLGCTLIGAAVIGGLPASFGTLHVHAVFDRSLADGLVLLALGLPGFSIALSVLLHRTPTAADVARFPIVLLPVIIGLGAYAFLMVALVVQGWNQLQAPVITTKAPGWTVLVQQFRSRVTPPDVAQSGLLFNFIGTLELVVLTLLVAVPIGIGVGLFVSEIAPGIPGQIVGFCTTALRGISVVLLALAAASVVAASRGTPSERVFGGFFIDVGGVERMGAGWSRGSYVTAALITALLIIPIVARATVEGCRSLPRGIREGSLALGATVDYTLVRLVVPWAVPNIITSVLLGAAEVSGGVSTLLFVAGSGEQGVSPLNEVTTLAFTVFWARFSVSKPFRDLEQPYQFTAAALLLVVAMVFTILSLVVKARYASRYRGA